MSYTQRFQEFRDTLLAEGVTAEKLEQLLKLADRYQLLQLIALNVNVGDKFKQEEAELEAALRVCLVEPIKKIRIGGDPRGFTVAVHLPSGKFNSLGGKEAGYGVPTRNFTARQIDLAAQAAPLHWEQSKTT